MGALTEGFGAARSKHDARVAEVRRKDDVVTHELRGLGDLIGSDAQFLKDNRVTYEFVHQTIQVRLDRSPLATVHYAAETQEFTATFLFDGSHSTMKTAEECATAIGGMVFAALQQKKGSIV